MNIDEQFDDIRKQMAAMEQRIGEKISASFVYYGEQIASGVRTGADFTEWMGKADADYTRVLAELAELKLRVAKLERREESHAK